MNNSKTPKIVVAAGLVVVYSGIAFYMLRDAPASNVAQNATPASTAPMTDAYVPAPAIAPASTDALIGVSEQSAVETGVPSPAAHITADSAASPAPRAQSVEPAVQRSELPISREQAISRQETVASLPADTATAAAELEDQGTATDLASAGADSASPARDAASSLQPEVAFSGNDSE